MPQVGEVDKGNKGSGDDDHPWLEAAWHKLLDASTTSSTTSLLDLRRCTDCRRRCENFSDGEIADEDFTIMM